MADYPPTPSFGLNLFDQDQYDPRFSISNYEQRAPRLKPGDESTGAHRSPSLISPLAHNKSATIDYGGAYPAEGARSDRLSSRASPLIHRSDIGDIYRYRTRRDVNGFARVSTREGQQLSVEEGELSENERQRTPVSDKAVERSTDLQNEAVDRYSRAEQNIDIYGRSIDLNQRRSASYSPSQNLLFDGSSATKMDNGTRRNISTIAQDIAGEFDISNSMHTHPPADALSWSQIVNDRAFRVAPTRAILNQARKEAQQAILQLFPLRVQIQDYINEGIDELILRRQLEGLGMPRPPTSEHAGILPSKEPFALASTRSERELGSTQRVRDQEPLTIPQQTNNSESTLTSMIDKDKPEHIAALSTEGTVDSAAAQSTAKAEKKRLLQQKIEALQKSREARAAKAAAKISVSRPASPVAHSDTARPLREMSTPSTSNKPFSPNKERNLELFQAPPEDRGTLTKPSIPGLFLATSKALSADAVHNPNASTTNTNQRKRPVASDFDGPPHFQAINKRPFGQNRINERLVIDVSDEESDHHDEMDIDRDLLLTDDPSSVIHPTKSSRPGSAQTPSSLSSTVPKRPLGVPTSASLAPNGNQTSVQSRGPEDLQQKELEIEKMKRRIAEAERRNRAKKVGSGTQTPQVFPIDDLGYPSLRNSSTMVNNVEVSVEIEKLIHDTSLEIEENEQKLSDTRAMAKEKANEIQNNDGHKQLRLARIAIDLPLINTKVEADQNRLARLRNEAAALEDAIQQGLEKKRQLAEEMELLNQEAEAFLQDQREKLRDLDQEAADIDQATNQTHEQPLEAVSTQEGSMEEREVIAQSPQPDVRQSTDVDTPSTKISHVTGLSGNNDGKHSEAEDDNPRGQPTATYDMQTTARDGLTSTPGCTPSVPHLSTDVITEPSSAIDSNSIFSQSSQSRNQSVSGQATNVPDDMSVVNQTESDSDNYEPPDATPSASDAAPTSHPSPSHISQDADEALPGGASPADTAPRITDVVSGTVTATNGDNPSMGTQIGPATTNGHYTPYQSPLRYFKAYRFHPEYRKEVEGGFKSITYSNNINANNEICPFELNGVCNDPACEFQHFKTMSLAEEAIIVELGNTAGFSDEDKPKFVAGLRSILQAMRHNKTKDFHIIAAEIAAFRSTFRQDPSKVLMLD